MRCSCAKHVARGVQATRHDVVHGADHTMRISSASDVKQSACIAMRISLWSHELSKKSLRHHSCTLVSRHTHLPPSSPLFQPIDVHQRGACAASEASQTLARHSCLAAPSGVSHEHSSTSSALSHSTLGGTSSASSVSHFQDLFIDRRSYFHFQNLVIDHHSRFETATG